jgi:hypothetical protein
LAAGSGHVAETSECARSIRPKETDPMRFVLIAILVFSSVSVTWLVGDEGARPDQVKAFMRTKLRHAHELFEAVVLEDYPVVAKQAEALKLISLDASWQVLETRDYLWESQEFQRTMDSLAKAAAARNHDGVVLAHFRMTQSCVNCHRIIRGMPGR